MAIAVNIKLGVGARIAVRVANFLARNGNKFRGLATTDGVYEVSTAIATISICTTIDRLTAGRGLTALGTGALGWYYDNDTKQFDQRLVDSLLWGGTIEDVAHLVGFEDFTAEWLKDPAKANALSVLPSSRYVSIIIALSLSGPP